MYKNTVALVEADSFSQQQLWEKYSIDGEKYCGPGVIRNRVQWESISLGEMVTVGKLDNMPVCISLCYAKIEQQLVTFWCCTSMVADYRLTTKWFADNLPQGTVLTDANNFHIALHHISFKNTAEANADKALDIVQSQWAKA